MYINVSMVKMYLTIFFNNIITITVLDIYKLVLK